MANVFKDISQFTLKSTLTGTEEFQVSATEKVTAQQIADLAPAKGVKQVVVTNFQTNAWTLSDGGSVNFQTGIEVGEIVTFTSAKDATNGPGVALFGYAIKSNNLVASYVGMAQDNKINGIPTIYAYKSAGLYATSWQQLPDGGIKTVEITDFAIPGLNITKDGESFLFYANDASNIPNSNHGATSFVGVAIASPIFITGDQRLLYYMMIDTAKAMFYTGYANLEDDTVTWSDTPVTRLGQAVQVTAFTESALSALLYSYKPGDFIPFYTNSVTTSADNQFPESGIFNGYISMGSNEGDYFQIFAFKSGSTKAYIGACIGSTTQWTALGDSSEGSGPIPGYKTLVSSWSSAVTTGSTGIINFREEIPKASRILVVAQIRSSPTGSATIRANVPLTLASINDSGQGILFDLSLQYLATGTNIGSIRLICTSLITGANGVQGMNTIVQSNNLANAGDIIQLSLYYK